MKTTSYGYLANVYHTTLSHLANASKQPGTDSEALSKVSTIGAENGAEMERFTDLLQVTAINLEKEIIT